MRMRLQRAITLALCSILPQGLGGCMASIATYNKARGEYTWPDRPKEQLPPLEPQPAYYALLPLTVPFDIVTSPFQLPLFVMWVTLPEAQTGIIKME